jgi:hypothetical protein
MLPGDIQGSWWIISSKEQKCFPLVNVARWGIRNGLSLRGTPGRMNEDPEID